MHFESVHPCSDQPAWVYHAASPSLLPLAAAAVWAAPAASDTLHDCSRTTHASGTPSGLHASRTAAHGSDAMPARIGDVLAAAAALLWNAAAPSDALCEPAGPSYSGRGRAGSGGNGCRSGSHHPDAAGCEHHFPEDAPQLPAGAMRDFRGSRPISRVLAAYAPFYAPFSGPAAAAASGGGGGGQDAAGESGGGGGMVRGFVDRSRARMEQRRVAAAGRWIRMRRLLNRILGTNEVASVGVRVVAAGNQGRQRRLLEAFNPVGAPLAAVAPPFLEEGFRQIHRRIVLQGGLLLMGAGLAAAAAREAWHHLWEWAKRRLLVRCQLDSRDDTYR